MGFQSLLLDTTKAKQFFILSYFSLAYHYKLIMLFFKNTISLPLHIFTKSYIYKNMYKNNVLGKKQSEYVHMYYMYHYK